MDEKDLTPTPEEATLEKEALEEVQDEELREKLAADLGIESDNPLLDTLVEREKESRSKLSKAIGQKIKFREAAKGVKPPQEKPKPDAAPKTAEEIAETVRQQFEQRDLDELDFPDELKKEIATVAKLKGISIRQAVKDPYIDYKVKAYETEQKSDDATITRKEKGGGKVQFDRSKPPKVDMSTEEGRKTWDEYTKFLRQPQ